MSLEPIANAMVVPYIELVIPTEIWVLPMDVPGLRTMPDHNLLEAGHGQERLQSEHNDN